MHTMTGGARPGPRGGPRAVRAVQLIRGTTRSTRRQAVPTPVEGLPTCTSGVECRSPPTGGADPGTKRLTDQDG
jgi:hypothetical protein